MKIRAEAGVGCRSSDRQDLVESYWVDGRTDGFGALTLDLAAELADSTTFDVGERRPGRTSAKRTVSAETSY
ncbi:hypothetical protein GN244_ATG02311 [Phytophthora infestans]|uniref:Uncharacterized protein n=1 Tax=Phytophthora infestans TaxID=4787 RepID=A0A833WJ05_PHYIN|nr:hypothetical protein GN244_ATG19323 [Phytophthora infestans]KAF4045323.1 hypothetical protein GN244_ATG02311 [Phytophthora infestans]